MGCEGDCGAVTDEAAVWSVAIVVSRKRKRDSPLDKRHPTLFAIDKVTSQRVYHHKHQLVERCFRRVLHIFHIPAIDTKLFELC